MNKRPLYRIYRGATLPPPVEYEEGDLFIEQSSLTIYLRDGGAWVPIAAPGAVTDATNIGVGTGEVFESKAGTILRFRTLLNTDGALNIQTVGDEVRIDLETSGPNAPVTGAQNVGGALEVFRDKTGNTLNFRTLEDVSGAYSILSGYGTDTIQFKGIGDTGLGESLIAGASSSDVELKGLESTSGNIIITDTGDTLDLDVDVAAAGAVTDGQNVGGGSGLIYRDKTGSTLNFRTLRDNGGAIDIATSGDEVLVSGARGTNLGTSGARVYAGLSGLNLQFRRLVAGTGIDITEGTNDITISATSGVIVHGGKSYSMCQNGCDIPYRRGTAFGYTNAIYYAYQYGNTSLPATISDFTVSIPQDGIWIILVSGRMRHTIDVSTGASPDNVRASASLLTDDGFVRLMFSGYEVEKSGDYYVVFSIYTEDVKAIGPQYIGGGTNVYVLTTLMRGTIATSASTIRWKHILLSHPSNDVGTVNSHNGTLYLSAVAIKVA